MGNDSKSPNRFTSADRLAALTVTLALLAGIVVLLLADDTVAEIAGICLLGVSGVAVVALGFLLVGESEDRHYRKGTP